MIECLLSRLRAIRSCDFLPEDSGKVGDSFSFLGFFPLLLHRRNSPFFLLVAGEVSSGERLAFELALISFILFPLFPCLRPPSVELSDDCLPPHPFLLLTSPFLRALAAAVFCTTRRLDTLRPGNPYFSAPLRNLDFLSLPPRLSFPLSSRCVPLSPRALEPSPGNAGFPLFFCNFGFSPPRHTDPPRALAVSSARTRFSSERELFLFYLD